MHTIREITRLATMLAGLIAPQIRLGLVSALSQLQINYILFFYQFIFCDGVCLSVVCNMCSRSVYTLTLKRFNQLDWPMLHSFIINK